MVLVDANRVKAAFGGEFELIHEVVVHVMRAPGVEQRGMDVDPDRRVLLPEIVGQLGIGHQMEPQQLHGSSFRTAFRKLSPQPDRTARTRQPATRAGGRQMDANAFLACGTWTEPVDSTCTYCNNFQCLAAWTALHAS